MRRPGAMMREVLGSMGKKVATICYPAVKVDMPDKFRGRIIFHQRRCIGCKLCVKDCPSEAIEIEKVADKVFDAKIRMDRCVFCGQCVESCNKDALESSRDYELAAFGREVLRVDANIDEPLPPPVEAPPPAAVDTATGG